MRTSVLVFAVLFVHSFPEGLAIGTAYASSTAGLGLYVIVAIALQNIPEGTSVAIPMDAAGFGRAQQFWAAVVTSAPQPVAALIAYALVEQVDGLLPVSFAFAAGAMLSLVAVEVLPEALMRPGRRAGLAGVAARRRADAGIQRGARRLRRPLDSVASTERSGGHLPMISLTAAAYIRPRELGLRHGPRRDGPAGADLRSRRAARARGTRDGHGARPLRRRGGHAQKRPGLGSRLRSRSRRSGRRRPRRAHGWQVGRERGPRRLTPGDSLTQDGPR